MDGCFAALSMTCFSRPAEARGKVKKKAVESAMEEIATPTLRSGQALGSAAKGVARRLLAMTNLGFHAALSMTNYLNRLSTSMTWSW
jgi:hypothetical protein